MRLDLINEFRLDIQAAGYRKAREEAGSGPIRPLRDLPALGV